MAQDPWHRSPHFEPTGIADDTAPPAGRRSADDPADRTLIQHIPAASFFETAPQREWSHFLVYTEPGGTPQRIRLGATPVRIGRRAPCDVVLTDGEVSGVHCEVHVQGRDVIVTDLGSTNGSFVDGQRAAPRARLGNGGMLRVGRQVLQLDSRDSNELAEAEVLARDLDRARRYVRSLLPAPLHDGPMRVQWFFEPSAQVGGDGFGYDALDGDHLVGYIIDVSGHGVGAAMHLVSVMNTLRQRALPDTDFHDPAQVLSRLNAMFQMDAHDGMLFSIWYGVLRLSTRELRYASAGHHPGYLRPAAGGPLQPLKTANPVIGALPDIAFRQAQAVVAPGDRLYLFSDGVFEVVTRNGAQWTLQGLTELICAGRAAAPGFETEPERLYRQVRSIARPGPLDDDFSLLVATLT